MNDQLVKNQLMKLCSNCGIVKMKTNFILETTMENIEVNVYSVVVINKKNGGIKNLK